MDVLCPVRVHDGMICSNPFDIMKAFRKAQYDDKERFELEDGDALQDVVLAYILSDKSRAKEMEEEWMDRVIETGESVFCGLRIHKSCSETNKVFAKLAKTVHEMQNELPEECHKYAQSRMLIFTVIEKCFKDIDTLHIYTETSESLVQLVREIVFLVAMHFDDEAGEYAQEMATDSIFVELIDMYTRLRERRPIPESLTSRLNDDSDDSDIASEITGYSVPVSLCRYDSDDEEDIYVPATGLKEHFFTYYNDHIIKKVKVRIPKTLISRFSDVRMNLRRMVLYTPFVLKTRPREVLKIIDCYQILTKDAPQFAGSTALGLCLCFQFMTPTHLRLCYEYTRKALQEYHEANGAIVI